MAKRSDGWKASQREKKRNARRELRRERNYDPNAYRQKDAQRTRGRASAETKEKYRERVRSYEEFLIEEKGMSEGYKVGDGHQAPTLQELKEFIRWLIGSIKGRLDPDGRPTMDTTLIWAQQFVPGFFLETGNPIPPHDTADLYYWIENTLVEEGIIKAIKKPKFNFKLSDFERTMVALWATDDPCFMSGRYRVQFHFITLQFLCTGARVASFTPASNKKAERGLRYKHIELVLFRAVDAPWRVGWRLDQQWVKNNKDPDNTIFGTAIWDCDEPIYSGALYLLALALADNALYGFSSPDEVFKQIIPEGQDELVLRWNEDVKDRCIVRQVTAEGVSEDPLTKERYQEAFRRILGNAGYFVTATVHAMRRALGAAVKEKYSSAHVAQILTQKSKTVYGNDYLANCSGVDVSNALLGRPADKTHIDYFQGYGQFHEHGLPRRLPIEEEQKIDSDTRLIDKANEIDNAKTDSDTKRLKSEYSVLKRRIYSTKFQQFQSEWVQKQRDWKILTRGRERLQYAEQTAEKQVQSKVMPELGRLAAIMSSNKPLMFNQKAAVVEDLYNQCLRDFDVVYRPGEEPVEGLCPVPSCGQTMEKLKKPQRSNHIHSCIQREKSRTMGIPIRQIKYCWECFSFHDGKRPEFEEHCASHISSMTTQHYEVMVYRHTTTRSGYCIDCMWDDKKLAIYRMRPFVRSAELRDHLDEHIDQKSWPSKCPDPLCCQISANEQDYRRHLHDVHRYNKPICIRGGRANTKRSSCELDRSLEPNIQQGRSRKARKCLLSSPANSKELKITFWKPSEEKHANINPLLPTTTGYSNQDQLEEPASQATDSFNGIGEKLPKCQDDSASFCSDLCSTPDLTDPSGISSSPATTVCPNIIPIDPQIMGASTAIPLDSGDDAESLREVRRHEQTPDRDCQRPGNHPSSQALQVNPVSKDNDLQDHVLLKTGDTLAHHPLSSHSSLREDNEHKSPSNKLSIGDGSALQSSFDKCKLDDAISTDRKATGPMTRAKAREHAAGHIPKNATSYKTPRKQNTYTQKEDSLLKRLMREGLSAQDTIRMFQEKFPGRSQSSLQRRWSRIQHVSPRSTRSRSKKVDVEDRP